MNEPFARLQELFHQAESLSRAERRAFLDQLRGDDRSLKRELESLLIDVSEADPFLDDPHGVTLQFFERYSVSLTIGRRIDRYTLRRFLSAGGMGAVYEAEQENPSRRVALKLLLQCAGSSEAHERFRREAEILAQLDHPHVAHFYDAGVEDLELSPEVSAPVPFVAMELVDGALPVTRYVHERQLDRRARLRLFIECCAGIQHGHHKGIVHRDVKPSNLLVSTTGTAKVIDFGIARIDRQDQSTPTLTRTGATMGTARYMSPEQCGGSSRTVDQRSDLYSLGVVLFELLLEEMPYDLQDSNPYESAVIVAERPPKSPRSLDPGFDPDLEAVLLRALEKDPSDRYASVAQLAADLENWLADRPVSARSPSVAEQVHRWVRRHRQLSATLLVASLLLLASWIATGISWWETRLAEQVAKVQAKEADEAAAEARVEAHRVQQMLGFLERTLNSVRAERLGQQATLADVLHEDETKRALDSVEDPLTRALIAGFLARTNATLHRTQAAEELGREAIEVLESHFGADDITVLETKMALARALAARLQTNDALALAHDAVAHWETHEDQLPVDAADAYRQLSSIYLGDSRIEEAYPLLRRSARLLEPHKVEQPSLYCTTLSRLLLVTRAIGTEAEEKALLDEMVTHAETYLAADHPVRVQCVYQRANDLYRRGHLEQAEPVLKQSLEAFRALHGDSHAWTNIASIDLSELYQREGRLTEAEELLQDRVEISEKTWGDDHRDTHTFRSRLGMIKTSLGKLPEAEDLLWEAFDGLVADAGFDNKGTLVAAEWLGLCLIETESWEELTELIDELLAESVSTLRPLIESRLRLECQRALALAHLDRWDEGEETMLESFAELTALPSPSPRDVHYARQFIESYRKRDVRRLAELPTQIPRK